MDAKLKPIHDWGLYGQKPVRNCPVIYSSRPITEDERLPFLFHFDMTPDGRVIQRRRHNHAGHGLQLVPVAIDTFLDRFDRPFNVTRTQVEPRGKKYDGAKLRELRAERGCGRPPSKRKKHA